MTRYAYLHGFASSPNSAKGAALATAFAKRGLTLERPMLSKPSFARLSIAAALAEIDTLTADGSRWCVVGSSLGGWLGARWAELHPERVEKLVLLCPGFDLAARWPKIVGEERLARWLKEGVLPFADHDGRVVGVHAEFFAEAASQPPRPVVPCPTLILHGSRDEVVGIESSRDYAAAHPDRVTLIELDDLHALSASIPRIVDETMAFFGV